MLIIDEAWVMFQTPIMRPLVREWLLTLDKANCVVILATQSLSQAAESGLLPILIESCATKIYLPNPEAGHAATRKLYEDFGLNETEIKAISEAQRQRQYYVCSFDGRCMIDLGLGRTTLAFAGVSDKDKLRHLAGLKREYGDESPRVWLEELGCAQPYYDVTESMNDSTFEAEKENA